jgi:hypothetical protein
MQGTIALLKPIACFGRAPCLRGRSWTQQMGGSMPITSHCAGIVPRLHTDGGGGGR